MNEWRKPLTPPSCRGQTHTHIRDVYTLNKDHGAFACVARLCSHTSRNDVVSLMKNMLMIPRYLMMRVPGRKESGVIFTTATELLPNERVERSERERPSGSGLQRSKDETVSSDRAGRGPNQGHVKRKQEERKRKKDEKEWRNQKILKNCGKIKTDMNFQAERNVNVKCSCKNPVSFFHSWTNMCAPICEYVSCVCDLTCSGEDVWCQDNHLESVRCHAYRAVEANRQDS